MLHTKIEVRYNGNKKEDWEVIHNLDEIGMDIMAAFDNYVARAKFPRIERFCEYVRSKDEENIICISKERYNELSRECGEKQID